MQFVYENHCIAWINLYVQPKPGLSAWLSEINKTEKTNENFSKLKISSMKFKMKFVKGHP